MFLWSIISTELIHRHTTHRYTQESGIYPLLIEVTAVIKRRAFTREGRRLCAVGIKFYRICTIFRFSRHRMDTAQHKIVVRNICHVVQGQTFGLVDGVSAGILGNLIGVQVFHVPVQDKSRIVVHTNFAHGHRGVICRFGIV